MILSITLNPAIDKVYAVDDFEKGGVFRPNAMTHTAGGKGLNVARVASIMGEEVTCSGLIGGLNGQFIHNEVIRQGMQSEFLSVEGDTRICINIMDQKAGISTEILEPGPLVTEDECICFLDKFTELAAKADVITASGSLPKGVPDDYYRRLIKIAKDLNKKILLDTSGSSLSEGAAEGPYMIKPNEDELESITGYKCRTMDNYKAAILKLNDMGIQMPVITMGREGCIVMIDGSVLNFHVPPVAVINTVGSGDSFLSGCAIGLSRKMSDIDVIKMGVACGTANTQFFKTGMVSQELVYKYFDIVMIDII